MEKIFKTRKVSLFLLLIVGSSLLQVDLHLKGDNPFDKVG